VDALVGETERLCAPGASAHLHAIADYGYMSTSTSAPAQVVHVMDWMVDTARAGLDGGPVPELADGPSCAPGASEPARAYGDGWAACREIAEQALRLNGFDDAADDMCRMVEERWEPTDERIAAAMTERLREDFGEASPPAEEPDTSGTPDVEVESLRAGDAVLYDGEREVIRDVRPCKINEDDGSEILFERGFSVAFRTGRTLRRAEPSGAPTGPGSVLARFEVVGEVDDKALRGWTEGDKQESTHDELTLLPDSWDLGTVITVTRGGPCLQGSAPGVDREHEQVMGWRSRALAAEGRLADLASVETDMRSVVAVAEARGSCPTLESMARIADRISAALEGCLQGSADALTRAVEDIHGELHRQRCDVGLPADLFQLMDWADRLRAALDAKGDT
jgi:hypothetical protein